MRAWTMRPGRISAALQAQIQLPRRGKVRRKDAAATPLSSRGATASATSPASESSGTRSSRSKVRTARFFSGLAMTGASQRSPTDRISSRRIRPVRRRSPSILQRAAQIPSRPSMTWPSQRHLGSFAAQTKARQAPSITTGITLPT